MTAPLSGRIFDRHGPRLLIPLGLGLITIFSVVVALVIDTGSLMQLAIVYIPVIVGSSMVIGPVQSFALSHLSRAMNAHGVTVMSTAFQIAGCIGSAVFTGIYGARTAATGQADAAFLTVGITLGVLACLGLVAGIGITNQREASTRLMAGAPTEDEQAATDAAETAVPATSLTALMKHDVWTLPATATVGDAMRLLVSRGISGVSIVDDQSVVRGFISDGDIFRALGTHVDAFATPYSFLVRRDDEEFDQTVADVIGRPALSIATRDVITVDAHADLGEVCNLLASKHLKKAPVTNDGHIVGIINRSNINRHLVSAYLDRH